MERTIKTGGDCGDSVSIDASGSGVVWLRVTRSSGEMCEIPIFARDAELVASALRDAVSVTTS